jgi:hypothetical protein
MTLESLKKTRFKISVMAGMNQRYHQHECLRWWRFDTGAKIVTALFAVIALALAIVLSLAEGEGWHNWHYIEVAVAFIAALAAIVLNVFPFGAWEAHHAEAFRRWTDLREEADGLEFDIENNDPPDQVRNELKTLDAKVHRLCGSESLADEWLWQKCQNSERRSRGMPLLPVHSRAPLRARIIAVFWP